MSATKLMEEAASRADEAARRLREAREGAFTPGSLKEWLSALTDYALALGEVQAYSQQSIHEKLHHLADEVHVPITAGAKRDPA